MQTQVYNKNKSYLGLEKIYMALMDTDVLLFVSSNDDVRYF